MSASDARAWLAKTWVQCTLLFVLVASFYIYNASPQPGYVDSGMVAANVYSMRVSSWVNVHLLHNFIGRFWLIIFPFGEIGWRLVVLGGLITAGAIVNLYRLLIAYEVEVRTAFIACIGTALAHALWWHAVTIEVYCINAFFTPLIFLQVLRYDREGELRYYYRAAFYYGLASVNHVLMGLFLFAFVGSVFNKKGAKEILRPVVAAKTLGWFVLGWQPAMLVLFSDIVNAINRSAYLDASGELQLAMGESLRGVVDQATGGSFKNQMFVEGEAFGGAWKWLKAGLFTIVVDFPNALMLFAPVGMVALWKRRELRMSTMFIFGGFLANFVWVMNYAVWDQWAFAIPSWMCWGFFAGLGLQWLVNRLRERGRTLALQATLVGTVLTFLIGPWLYVSVERWAREDGFWKDYFAFFDGYGENYRASDYFASPFKRGWTQPRELAERMWEIFPEGAIIYDDHTRTWFLMHLYYNSCLGKRRDLTNWNVGIVGDWMVEVPPFGEQMIADLMAQRPVYTTSLHNMPGRALISYAVARAHGLEEEQTRALMGQPIERLLQTVPQLKVEAIRLFPDDPFEVYALSVDPEHLLAVTRVEEGALAVSERPEVGELGPEPSDSASGGAVLRWTDAGAGSTMSVAFQLDRTLRFGLRVKGNFEAVSRLTLDGAVEARKLDAQTFVFDGFEFNPGLHQLSFEAAGGGPIELDYVEQLPIVGG